MNRPHRNARGFTLIEVTIAIVVLLGAAYISLILAKNKIQTESVATVVNVEANELNMMMAAAQTYVPTNSAGWVANALHPISVDTLIANGNLPQSFALRNSVTGTSPLFEPYAILAAISSVDSKPRIMVTTGGDPAPARLARYGLQLAIPDVQTLQQQIAEKAQQLANNPCGVVLNGATVVTGNYGAFSESISPPFFGGGPPNYARPALLSGYPDLVVPGPTATNASLYKACEIRQPKIPVAGNGQVPTNPSCQTGWTQLAKFPFCGTANYAWTPQYAVYGSAVGDITLSPGNTPTTSQLIDTVWCYTANQPGCTYPGGPNALPGYYQRTDLYTNYSYYSNVLINGAVVATDIGCTGSGYYQTSEPLGGTCYPGNGGGLYQCVYPTGGTSWAITSLNPAFDLLCCLPN
jgi:prepilin-type N-terminal cleavage/methylation domain-containing protein